MVISGLTNSPEFGMIDSTSPILWGPTRNPWNVDYTPGGSSGGSGSAVAAGLCAVALGSDTMGSVRVPASYCGVVGFKAGFEVIPTAGSVALCGRLDHIGPLTRSIRDAQTVATIEYFLLSLPSNLLWPCRCRGRRGSDG